MKTNAGIEKIVQKSRRMFRTPENLLHYDDKDFEEAERKFVKFMLQSGGLRSSETVRLQEGDIPDRRKG